MEERNASRSAQTSPDDAAELSLAVESASVVAPVVGDDAVEDESSLEPHDATRAPTAANTTSRRTICDMARCFIASVLHR
jgi:hypothetical protein